MYDIVVDFFAEAQLDSHVRFASTVNMTFARSITNSFENALQNLSTNPDRHPLWLTDFPIPRAYRKILIRKRYLILFYIEENNIFIDYILDCRMNNSNFLYF